MHEEIGKTYKFPAKDRSTKIGKCVGIDSAPTYKHRMGKYLIFGCDGEPHYAPQDKCTEVKSEQ